ncbi:uncharacterized protein LY89DRAFT_674982 [Mollisia scopiformis]|uniref:F-box domain-containing protein n=1 Tax=Mollisia scopiformis TaxID=149040 RepID=A0A194WSD8_MOLSC|nr:uncharacterized protein LY89DRAFT_674982 [Mollisia scopiformis]KUJ10880.1 hypothetical protein LY89DRAFT_674982 [Mollisia scopiformis]
MSSNLDTEIEQCQSPLAHCGSATSTVTSPSLTSSSISSMMLSYDCDADKEQKSESQPIEKQRILQTSTLVNELPLVIHYEIFKYLGTATRRLLGDTCISFYETYKEHFNNEAIIIRHSELLNLMPGGGMLLGTTEYQTIVANWLSRPESQADHRRTWLAQIVRRTDDADERRNMANNGKEYKLVAGPGKKLGRKTINYGGKANLEVEQAWDRRELRCGWAGMTQGEALRGHSAVAQSSSGRAAVAQASTEESSSAEEP